MKYCSQCGNKMLDDMKFCQKCGTKYKDTIAEDIPITAHEEYVSEVNAEKRNEQRAKTAKSKKVVVIPDKTPAEKMVEWVCKYWKESTSVLMGITTTGKLIMLFGIDGLVAYLICFGVSSIASYFLILAIRKKWKAYQNAEDKKALFLNDVLKITAALSVMFEGVRHGAGVLKIVCERVYRFCLRHRKIVTPIATGCVLVMLVIFAVARICDYAETGSSEPTQITVKVEETEPETEHSATKLVITEETTVLETTVYETESLETEATASTKPEPVTTEPEFSTLVWPRGELAKIIPLPESQYGEIHQVSENSMAILVKQVVAEAFNNYVTECYDMGFTVISYESAAEFEATNQEGYRLSLQWYTGDEMQIVLQAPLCSVELEINCLINLFFNKYDIEVNLDGKEITSIVHGESITLDLELERGIHELEIIKSGWLEPKGKTTFAVTSDARIAYRVSCGSDVISLKQTEFVDLRPLTENEARTPASASELRFENYKDVMKKLQDVGFTNIKTEILYDIVYGWTSEGEVDSVNIAGNTDFAAGDIFNSDVEVTITYHMWEDDDPARIKMTKNAADYEGQQYSDVITMFRKLGFTNIYVQKIDTSDNTYTDGEVSRVTIDYEYFEIGDGFLPEDKVLIKYYVVSIIETEPITTIHEIPKSTENTYEATENTQEDEIVYPKRSVLTVDNCEELKKIIGMDRQKNGNNIKKFAMAHKGSTIKLEMLTAYVKHHGTYKTRFDYLLYAVNGDNVMLAGPAFMFEDVNYYDLNLRGSNIPDSFGTGIHCMVEAKILGYENDMIILEPEEIYIIKEY